MSEDFLKKLEKAVNEGEFNSDAAKKITAISEAAEKIKFKDDKEVEAKAKERINRIEPETVSEEEVKKINSEHDKKIAAIRKQDAINNNVANLIQIEDMVDLSVEDMFSFVDELEDKFEKELKEDEQFAETAKHIEKIKKKYGEIRKSIKKK